MEVNYDIWSGESIETIIQTIAEFRIQVLPDNENIQQLLSEEINTLHHYFDDQALIVVANDCGSFAGYMAAVALSEFHPNLMSFSHFGDDLKVSEGLIVHPYYRKMGIGQSLIRECVNECEIRDLQSIIIDPKLSDTNDETVMHICKVSGFHPVPTGDSTIWLKQIGETFGATETHGPLKAS